MAPKRPIVDDDGEYAQPNKISRGAKTDRKALFTAHITALNNQFAEWVQSQQPKHGSELWTPGVKDYLKHTEKLLQDFKDVVDSAKGSSLALTTSKQTPMFGPNGAFGMQAFSKRDSDSSITTQADSANNNKTDTTPSFLLGPSTSTSTTSTFTPAFGATSTGNANGSTTGFVFGAPSSSANNNAGAAAASTGGFFSFGAASTGTGGETAASAAKPSTDSAPTTTTTGAAAAPAATGNLFSFGQSTGTVPAPTFGASSTGFGGFNFGGVVPAKPTEANTQGGSSGAEEGEEEEPQKYESAVEANEEAGSIAFKSKAKLNLMKSGAWESMGVGQLMVRTPKNEPAKPFITFTTEAGRVLYCANIHKTMKVIHNEQKNTVTWGAVWAPPDKDKDGDKAEKPKPALTSVLAQLPKGQCPKFKEEIEKLQSNMP